MKPVTIVLALTCLLVGCKEYKGELALQQALTLRAKKGEVTLPAGAYRAEIKPGSDEVQLKIRVNGKDQKVEFALPNGTYIHSFAQIDLTPAQSGQLYHIKGTETTKVLSRSSTKRGSQVCGEPDTECGWENPPEGGLGDWICKEYNKYEAIEYYDIKREHTHQLFVLNSQNNQTLGIFTAVTSEQERIVDVVGSCQ